MISFATSQLRWAFVVWITVGAAIGVQIGQRSVFLAMSRTQVTVDEMRRHRAERQRRRRMRLRRSDRRLLACR